MYKRMVYESAVSQANVYAPLLASLVAPQDPHFSINTEVVVTRLRIAITNAEPCSVDTQPPTVSSPSRQAWPVESCYSVDDACLWFDMIATKRLDSQRFVYSCAQDHHAAPSTALSLFPPSASTRFI
jgi:hypothetical protein